LPAGPAQRCLGLRGVCRLAAARDPRYIGGGFPLNGAVNSPCAARVRIKARTQRRSAESE
jgi:hypothetical protein